LKNANKVQKVAPYWVATQQDALHAVEADVHTWLRDHGHLATEPQRQEMADHLYALEDHHSALVKLQVASNLPLWLPPGTQETEIDKANKVWRDVQAGTGNLRIASKSPDFHGSTLADIAKLLQQPHGRAILHELNLPQPKNMKREVTISDDWSTTFGKRKREYKGGSWATPTEDPTQAHRMVIGTNLPGPGTGSYVQIDRAHRETETGAHGDTGVPMPHYVTLGHELGHALHNVRGTARVQTAAFDTLAPIDKSLWSSAEEHANITLNENVIRAQHGLPSRAYHRPPATVLVTRLRAALQDRVDQMFLDIPKLQGADWLDPRSTRFDEASANDPAFYKKANAQIDWIYRQRSIRRVAPYAAAVAFPLAAYGLHSWFNG
ncbi:MAG TPA: M91 family zinc metallopeptidase, partial [Acetobacteraceae bacterium]|nr:M91 family zinc metallopeptidase [Acetobacteraceae bacterium]